MAFIPVKTSCVCVCLCVTRRVHGNIQPCACTSIHPGVGHRQPSQALGDKGNQALSPLRFPGLQMGSPLRCRGAEHLPEAHRGQTPLHFPLFLFLICWKFWHILAQSLSPGCQLLPVVTESVLSAVQWDAHRDRKLQCQARTLEPGPSSATDELHGLWPRL